ncbi:protein MAIN-LIKE 1-like [Vicia villosa]|uniref:protein MAIN-LIKE 1-like n=1 Tax=Vicia villosa TaxID=3911 RepID=UPI00273B9710|nr:protein MAIN-LIKE 1-like [Vicia villosa]
MTYRASRLRHHRVAQHAYVQRERIQTTQPIPVSGQAVPDAPHTSSSSGVTDASPTTSPPGPPADALLHRHHLRRERPLERDTLKVISHGRTISTLIPPVKPWFEELLLLSGLKDLAKCGYSMVNKGMINAFFERWHHETSSFHIPHGEMTITLDDVTCLLHLQIRGRFLDHESIGKEEVLDLLVEMLGVTFESALGEINKTRGSHVSYNYLDQMFEDEIQHAREADGDVEQVTIHRRFAMRANLLYLVGTQIFVNTSATYTDIMYLWFFADFETIHQWNWGASCLVYLHTKLDEGIKWNTKQITDNMSLMTI